MPKPEHEKQIFLVYCLNTTKQNSWIFCLLCLTCWC